MHTAPTSPAESPLSEGRLSFIADDCIDAFSRLTEEATGLERLLRRWSRHTESLPDRQLNIHDIAIGSTVLSRLVAIRKTMLRTATDPSTLNNRRTLTNELARAKIISQAAQQDPSSIAKVSPPPVASTPPSPPSSDSSSVSYSPPPNSPSMSPAHTRAATASPRTPANLIREIPELPTIPLDKLSPALASILRKTEKLNGEAPQKRTNRRSPAPSPAPSAGSSPGALSKATPSPKAEAMAESEPPPSEAEITATLDFLEQLLNSPLCAAPPPALPPENAQPPPPT